MIDDTRITQHFRSDEIGFIEQVQGWIRQANDEYRPILTHFLNPRERLIAETLVNREDDLKHASNGGYLHAEMQRMLIYPAYHEVEVADFELQALQIVYPVKFAEIKHHQILGTLANQGIERNIFGDIVGNDETWQFIVEQKMVEFFDLQIDRIGKIKVHLTPITLAEIIQPQDDWETMTTTVASLRLDTVISTCFNFSRNRIKEHIEAGNVRVNWREMNKPDYELAINDVVSVRGFGRLQVTEVNGLTKKEKIKITVAMIQNKKSEEKLMALTPIDIQNKEFTKSGRKGYEATEVNNYLDQVITDFAAVIEENQQLKTRVADYEANDTQIEEMKQSVTQSILVAQEAADRLKRTADESAKRLCQRRKKKHTV